jgi:hypothetical protein
MLSFQKLRVYQQSIQFLAFVVELIAELPKGHAEFYTHARASAMEAASVLDTLKVMHLVDEARYARGIDLLEGIVAMLTKMT